MSMTALKSKEAAIIVRSGPGDATRRRRPELEALIIVWHDVLPELVMRVVSDEKFIKALDRELEIFNYFIPATELFPTTSRSRSRIARPPSGNFSHHHQLT